MTYPSDQRSTHGLILVTFLLSLVPAFVSAQSTGDPTVLIVTAHPDDEAMFAGAVYKITHELGGKVDLALITDGAGGYRFSTFAEPIYGLKLTDEDVARQYLPAIRKQELMAGGEIIGIRNYFFFDQPDPGYVSRNADTVMTKQWSADDVRNRLVQIMRAGEYDFVFVHLPVSFFHGHHKAASLLALEAAHELGEARPAVLGGWITAVIDTMDVDYNEIAGHPISRFSEGQPIFVFDRMQPVGTDGRLNYGIVASWLIAEHKTQGTMQRFLNRGETEEYWYFDANRDEDLEKTRKLFQRLGEVRQD
jgi:LmbE family N-acetylglucosaminyl deacetylase